MEENKTSTNSSGIEKLCEGTTKQTRAPRSPEGKILAANKHPGGRPTKYCDDVASKIINAIRAGNYMETAAAFAGVDKTTLYDWMKQGAAGKSPEMEEFSNAIKRALAESEFIDLSLIQKAAREGAWQASAWRLERRFRDRWGKSLEVGDIKNKSTEELLALLEDADTA